MNIKAKLKMYKDYFKYIMEHKVNVFKVCWKKKMYLHAITHDLSKFSPAEFFPYAEWFYGEYGTNIDSTLLLIPQIKEKHERCKAKFEKAWRHHYRRNKHHWNHWVGTNMPIKYISQMICDWDAMSIKFGGTKYEFYMNNYDNIDLSLNSRLDLEFMIGLIGGEALVSNVTWRAHCERLNITMLEDLKNLKYIK